MGEPSGQSAGAIRFAVPGGTGGHAAPGSVWPPLRAGAEHGAGSLGAHRSDMVARLAIHRCATSNARDMTRVIARACGRARRSAQRTRQIRSGQSCSRARAASRKHAPRSFRRPDLDLLISVERQPLRTTEVPYRNRQRLRAIGPFLDPVVLERGLKGRTVLLDPQASDVCHGSPSPVSSHRSTPRTSTALPCSTSSMRCSGRSTIKSRPRAIESGMHRGGA